MKRSRVVEVMNLNNGECRVYVGISPKRAVILAYEQERRNWAWWNTPLSDHPLLRETPMYYQCGDWCARKDQP